MPETNTQNPNEQNQNTNFQNGANNVNRTNYTNPIQNEFENSATYRVIHKVGDKVTESVNNLDGEKISREVQGAVNGVVNEVNRVAETVNRKFNTNARTNYQPPQGQNPDGTYHYSYTQTTRSNYKRPNTNPNQAPSSAPGGPYNPPRGAAAQNANPAAKQNRKPPKEPRKQDMIEKYKPSNGRYWLTGIVCMLYALNGPLYRWQDLITLAVVGTAAFFIGGKIFKGKKYYVPAESVQQEKQPEPKPKEEPKKKVSTGDPEVDKIIEEGYKYLHELRDVNIRIPDEVMTKRIDRMEAASADIFAYITEHPEKAAEIRRFMNYYLPTTLKLLNSYDKLSRQRVKGENIQKTMFEIEGMMETIAGAFEKQLDSLFDDDAMDIAADISVMESILKQEGLSDDENMKMPSAQENAGIPDLKMPGFGPNETNKTQTK